jgi:NAD(P)-dependent dehydrogenase (short-subunit alcohol dehydrogenase family)
MVLDVFDLTGKVAVVTGSTKGLGRAMAAGLANAGADVVVSSRKQELCDAAAAEIARASGRKTLGLACHVGDWERIPHFVDEVIDHFGRIDVLVNNAGINPATVPIADMTFEFWQKVLSVNLTGPVRMAQCVAATMREHGGGSIINIASMAAYEPGFGNAAYGASKAGLVNLSRTMAVEWAPYRIRVNVIAPGAITSEMTEAAERGWPGFYDRAAGAALQKRVAEPHEIIGPVVYLASDASSFVTGEDHCVSGGLRR